MFRNTLTLVENERVQGYFRAIGQNFCPFISPAEEAGVLFFSTYDLVGDPAQWERWIFSIAVVHTELLRFERRRQTPRGGALFCENVFFEPNDCSVNDLETHLGWPHWILKLIYLEVGVLYGKFWKGEQTRDRRGLDIPEPPVNFLSIRSAIKRKDARFLNGRKELQEILLASEDSGASCFYKVPLSAQCRTAIETLQSAFHAEMLTQTTALALASHLYALPLFEECKQWATEYSSQKESASA